MDTAAMPAIADVDLQAEVERAIRSLDIVRPTRAEVAVTVTGGQAAVTGIVPSIMAATEIERAVRSVPGLTDATLNLYDDGALMRQVAWALATDARTRDIPPGYQVNSLFGNVAVIGAFGTEQICAAIAEVAQSVEGVRGVKVASPI